MVRLARKYLISFVDSILRSPTEAFGDDWLLSPLSKMNSNLNGERLEFQACLDADFQKAQLTSFRQGDTVVLKFDRTKSQQALYNIILDVDSYPRYYFLSIDGNTFPIVPAGN